MLGIKPGVWIAFVALTVTGGFAAFWREPLSSLNSVVSPELRQEDAAAPSISWKQGADVLGAEGESVALAADAFREVDEPDEKELEWETEDLERGATEAELPWSSGEFSRLVGAGRRRDDSGNVLSGSLPRDNEQDLFSPQDLLALQEAGAVVSGGSLLGGVVDRGGAPERVEPPAPDPDPAEEEIEDLGLWFVGQSRGYVMLPLMQPEARAAMERQIEALLDSRVRDLYLGVLTDGTFGIDLDYLKETIERLTAGPRRLRLVLYLSNGSTMRHYNVTRINAGFTRIEPRQFRNLIRYDPVTRERFQAMVRSVKPVFELNRRLKPENENIAVVMLEDNLNSESYLAMRELAAAVLGDDLVSFVRNPCEGCYSGNDGESWGDGLERHNPWQLGLLGARDGFTLDGEGYAFPGEASLNRLPVEGVKELLRLGLELRLRYFGLWRAERQGLYQGSRPHPVDRVYEYPSDEQLAAEIELLQYGLPEELLKKK